MYLYHATSKKYLDSILREGLVLNPPSPQFFRHVLGEQDISRI